MNLKTLKSGTDIRGTAIAGDKPADLTPEAVSALVRGFGLVFDCQAIALGHDSRLSAAELSAAAAEGLVADGRNVKFCGLCSTPSMFMATVLCGCDGAVMLTASHHPYDKNGLKFFTKEGGVTSAQLDEIISAAEKIIENQHAPVTPFKSEYAMGVQEGAGGRSESSPRNREPILPVGTFTEEDYIESYCAFMRGIFIRELGKDPLKGFKIAVDAGNGAAGFYAERILEPLGADISGSQFLDPDGTFPNHEPNPENKRAMQSISRRVKDTSSDLGIIFDTDGDRAAIVSADGSEINRNRLIALTASIVLREYKGAHIVTDSVTSEGLKEFITQKGGVHVRYKRGYQNVISYAKQLNAEGKNAPLAIETSGHAALRENYFLDDGAYLAARIIIEAVRLKRKGAILTDLIKDLKEPAEEKAVRIALTGADWRKTAQKILDRLTVFSAEYKIADNSFEGIRTYIEDGWFMARVSVHDPVIPINIESGGAGGAKKIAQLLLGALEGTDGADLTPLREFCD